MRALFTFLLLLTAGTAQAADDTGPLTTDPQADAMFPPSVEELTIELEGKRLSALLYLANGFGP